MKRSNGDKGSTSASEAIITIARARHISISRLVVGYGSRLHDARRDSAMDEPLVGTA
jgi:hypothetical protein